MGYRRDGLPKPTIYILAIVRFEASLRFGLPREEERASAVGRQPAADWLKGRPSN